MISETYEKLFPLQRAAVAALAPFACRDTEVREANTVNALYIEAVRAKRTLGTSRFLATLCSPTAAHQMFELTRAAFDALQDLIIACELVALQEAPG